MTVGRVQHHVAIISTRSACVHHASIVCRYTLPNFSPIQARRWQSSATTKEIPISGNGHLVANINEIPASCFVESAVYPESSLNRSHKKTTIDLSTTRPAKLDSPTAPERRDYPDGNIPLGDRVKYLFKLGKSFLLFYKTGLKNVWQNSKRYRALRSDFRGHALNTIAKYGGQTIEKKLVPEISRSEYQLSLRTRHDILKMIPFSLVFVICGEFTPLAIIALGSSIVPYTCRIPRQLENDIGKKLRQDKQYMNDLPRLHPEIETPLEDPDWRIEHLDAFRLGLTSIRTPLPVLGPLYHALITRPRLIRHCDNLVSDTILIHRQGGPYGLSYLDLYEWADSYGLYSLHRYIEECRKTGQDPKNEKLKTALLPAIDGEMRYMLGQVADWSRLKPSEQWRIGLRTVGSNSPDWKARVQDMRREWEQA